MIKSLRSFFRFGRLNKALQEAQSHQYINQLDAMRACNQLFRTKGKDYWVVKHHQENLFWVVRTASAKTLAKEGHTILKPYK